MKNKTILAVLLVIAVIASGCIVWWYLNYTDYLSKTLHETNRWAVIEDSHGDIMAVETSKDEVWNTFVNLNQNKSEMWIGGIVEEYDNKWGYRFKPTTIIVAELTIEAAQTWIRGLSEDLDYWINTWAKETYVLVRVIEIHA
jgi:hypothetical protein